MKEEEEEYSILENKFREWFGKTVPAAIPLPEKAERSLRNRAPAALPFPAKGNHLDQGSPRKPANNSPDLWKFLSSGFMGAAYFGALVGFILIILNMSQVGWYPDHWPGQYLILFFVIVIGFTIGLANGYASQRGQP